MSYAGRLATLRIRVFDPHGVRCRDERCPQCGAKMLREGSEHHKLWLQRHRSHMTD
jgi:hypothetical protein